MAKRQPEIRIARANNPPPADDCYRVLVDRLWPRGIKKENLNLDRWMKDLTPSTDLRRWFNHDPQRWDQFRKRYFKELDALSDSVSEMLKTAGERPILFLYGARDEQHNQAIVLKEWIEKHAEALK